MLLWRGSTVRAVIGGLGAAVVALAGAYLTSLQIDPPVTAEDKATAHTWGLVSIWVVAGVALIGSLSRVFHLVFFGRRDEARAHVQQALKVLVWDVHELTDIDVRTLGASAWMVQGFWPFSWLHRLGRERFSAVPPPSRIRWTKGKGHIGRCWETGQQVVANVKARDSEQQSISSAAEWGALPQDRRMGMSFKEYERIRRKYGTVIAMPVTDGKRGNRVVGVISLDAPPGAGHRQLVTPAVLEKVGQAADAVAAFIC